MRKHIEHFNLECLTASELVVINRVTLAQPLLSLSVFICKVWQSGLACLPACLPALEDGCGGSALRTGEGWVSWPFSDTALPPSPLPTRPCAARASYLSSSSLCCMAPGPRLPLGA